MYEQGLAVAGEGPEVVAHAENVLGMQKLEELKGHNTPNAPFSCSSCGAMSC